MPKMLHWEPSWDHEEEGLYVKQTWIENWEETAGIVQILNRVGCVLPIHLWSRCCRTVIYREHHPNGYIYIYINKVKKFFWLCPWCVEFPGAGVEPEAQQWQSWVLNHKGTRYSKTVNFYMRNKLSIQSSVSHESFRRTLVAQESRIFRLLTDNHSVYSRWLTIDCLCTT